MDIWVSSVVVPLGGYQEGPYTGVDCSHFCMQEIDSLQKFPDGAPNKVLIKTSTLHEDGIHVAEAHLRYLQSQSFVPSTRPHNLKRVVEISDISSTNVVAWQHFGESLVERQLAMLDRVMYVDLQSHILVVSAVKVSRP